MFALQCSRLLFFMCDSWLGCDQEYEVELNVGEAAEGSGSEEMSEGRRLALLCDSWLGCDQEYEVELNVGEAAEGSGSEEMSE
ncbi:hypothetical protein OEZ85_005839 [Tetradesmus obliquus]|uniref:Uncharacterized protein n=1 Tax=Tetradesmus obliquus TaxID=3088 RepID=A0ABY8UH07_TETOB|nr:hypothetical protein OEZ85_005839 [Tetradesmus obliquus]